MKIGLLFNTEKSCHILVCIFRKKLNVQTQCQVYFYVLHPQETKEDSNTVEKNEWGRNEIDYST